MRESGRGIEKLEWVVSQAMVPYEIWLSKCGEDRAWGGERDRTLEKRARVR